MQSRSSRTMIKKAWKGPGKPCQWAALSLTFFVLYGLISVSPKAQSQEPLAEPKKPVVTDLCAWQEDYAFFTGEEKDPKPCTDEYASLEEAREAKQVAKPVENKQAAFTEEIRSMVIGFPMEEMSSAITQYDREIAGLIVGIGKKESNWGKRTPKLRGEECYNFWGYRGPGDRGLTPDGYGCFMTPEAAVETIGDRLVKLRELRQSSEPARMIVWKCGSTCAGHSDESVRKWISDVNLYYRQIAGR